MALANDNSYRFVLDLIVKWSVRWMNAAVACPCFTTFIVYYIEGDHGHLMQEE